MEEIRSFIAIELPEEVKRGLARLQAQLKAGKQPSVKWVDPYNIHLTLKFLGNITTDKIGGITEAMEVAAQGIAPFPLELSDLGAFPNLRRVQVVWVGVSGELAQLSQLHQRLESNLTPLGFAPENRPFTPHLTLARFREQASPEEQQNLGQLLVGKKLEATYGFTVHAINLMQSELTREGPIYRLTSSVELKKTLAK